MDTLTAIEKLTAIQSEIEEIKRLLSNSDDVEELDLNARRKKARSELFKHISKESTLALNNDRYIAYKLQELELPYNENLIKDINSIVNTYNISIGKVAETLEKVKKANDKQPKKDLNKYICGCLYNLAQK